MSIITEKVKIWSVEGLNLALGDVKDKVARTWMEHIDLNDSRFHNATMEQLENEGFIETAEDYDTIEEIVSKAIEEEREISGIKIKE